MCAFLTDVILAYRSGAGWDKDCSLRVAEVESIADGERCRVTRSVSLPHRARVVARSDYDRHATSGELVLVERAWPAAAHRVHGVRPWVDHRTKQLREQNLVTNSGYRLGAATAASSQTDQRANTGVERIGQIDGAQATVVGHDERDTVGQKRTD